MGESVFCLLGWSDNLHHTENDSSRHLFIFRDFCNTLFDELKQIAEIINKIEGWNFSRIRIEQDANLWNYVDVVRPDGYFITQMAGQRSAYNFLDAFSWTPASFGPGWWQTVAELANQFRSHGCHIIAQAEYDVPYWFHDVESFLFWLLSVPWPEKIELEKHWQQINHILETSQTERGIETNEHRGLLIIQK